MLKQLLVEELNRLTNTNEVIEEKVVYVESLKKLIRDLTANRDILARDFHYKEMNDEFVANKEKDKSDDMANFVL